MIKSRDTEAELIAGSKRKMLGRKTWQRMLAERGTPQAIRRENEPEPTCRHFPVWCVDRKIEVVHFQPG